MVRQARRSISGSQKCRVGLALLFLRTKNPASDPPKYFWESKMIGNFRLITFESQKWSGGPVEESLKAKKSASGEVFASLLPREGP